MDDKKEKMPLEIHDTICCIQKLIDKKSYEEALTLCHLNLCSTNKKIVILKIHILFKLAKYLEIITECEKAYTIWPEEHFLKSKNTAISHLVREHIKKDEYEKALKYLTNEMCYQDDVLLGQKITIYIRLERFVEALAICPSLTTTHNSYLEKKKISILFRLKNYNEIIRECSLASRIWKDDYFASAKNTAVGHLVKEMNQRGAYQEALALFKKEFIYERDKDIIKSILKELENNGKFTEEIEYFTDELCCLYKDFYQKKIFLLFILKRYEEILEEALKAFLFLKDACFLKSRDTAISHLIKSLVSNGKFEEALKYYSYDFCEPNLILETQKIMILLELERYQDVIDVCTENLKIWKKEPFFIERRKQALEFVNTQRMIKENPYLTKIYFNALSFEELETLEIEEFEKMILKLAFYEKSQKVCDYKKGLQLIKMGLFSTVFSEQQKSLLGNLKEKFISKISSKRYKLVDWNYYCSILNCFIDKDYETKEKSSLRQLKIKK